ncbi:hypothetical protein ACFUOZ_19760 [Paenarthrobacter sp. NPDC057355]
MRATAARTVTAAAVTVIITVTAMLMAVPAVVVVESPIWSPHTSFSNEQ